MVDAPIYPQRCRHGLRVPVAVQGVDQVAGVCRTDRDAEEAEHVVEGSADPFTDSRGLVTIARVTNAGLILNIIGTLMLVFVAFPQPDHSGDYSGTSAGGLHLDRRGAGGRELRRRAAERRRMYQLLAILALYFLVLGFGLQLADQLAE